MPLKEKKPTNTLWYISPSPRESPRGLSLPPHAVSLSILIINVNVLNNQSIQTVRPRNPPLAVLAGNGALHHPLSSSLPRKLSCRFPLSSLAFGFSSGAKRASKWRRKVSDKNIHYITFCYHHLHTIPFCYFPSFVPFTSVSFGEFWGRPLLVARGLIATTVSRH